MATASPSPDWLISNTSDVHVVRDRSCFVDYHDFATQVGSIYASGSSMPGVGVGTVQLPVTSKDGPNPETTIWIIKNVVHVPDMVCNVFALRRAHDAMVLLRGGEYCVSLGDDASPLVANLSKSITLHGHTIALIDRNKRLPCLQLASPPHGLAWAPTIFDKADTTVAYVINVCWSRTERQRWEAFCPTASEASATATHDAPAYSAAEKKWLKTYFDDEFSFLTMHQLSIYDEKDREEGRRIARALMSEWAPSLPERQESYFDMKWDTSSDGEDDDGDGLSQADSATSFERDFEENPASHFADHFFSEEELDWIQARFRHSFEFITCMGWNVFKDEQCEEARAYVRSELAGPE